jgi:uncharacterized protein (DUF2384 family)
MTATALFGTVARDDRLGFWRGGGVDARKVVDFLELSRADVAKVAGVAPASVRFDQKTPREVRDRIDEIANVVSLVAQFFDGDGSRTALWFKTPNPMLGGISPRDMIRFGRYQRLLKFVLEALDENAGSVSSTRAETSPA